MTTKTRTETKLVHNTAEVAQFVGWFRSFWCRFSDGRREEVLWLPRCAGRFNDEVDRSETIDVDEDEVYTSCGVRCAA